MCSRLVSGLLLATKPNAELLEVSVGARGRSALGSGYDPASDSESDAARRVL